MVKGKMKDPSLCLSEHYLLQHISTEEILYLKGYLHLNYSQKAPSEDSVTLWVKVNNFTK